MKTAALGSFGGSVSLGFAAFDVLPHSASLRLIFSPYPKAFSPYPKAFSLYPKAFSPYPKAFGSKASLSVCGSKNYFGGKNLIGGKKLVVGKCC